MSVDREPDDFSDIKDETDRHIWLAQLIAEFITPEDDQLELFARVIKLYEVSLSAPTTATRPEREAQEAGPVQQFFGNCEGCGAAEWFERMVNAVMEQDKAVVAGDTLRAETYRNIASSSAMELARGYRTQIRNALATPPDAAATIERLQEKVRNLTVLLDQQFGTPCAQIAYAAELASLREKVKADVAAAYEDAARVAYDTLAAWGDYGWKCQAEGLQEAIRARAALTTEEG